MARGEPLIIELGWPDKVLSPNARVHFMQVSRAKKAAKSEAFWATKVVKPLKWTHDGSALSINLIAHPPKNWATGDADNLIARAKAHIDGAADALGINDKLFNAPTVTWADKCEHGRLIMEISS